MPFLTYCSFSGEVSLIVSAGLEESLKTRGFLATADRCRCRADDRRINGLRISSYLRELEIGLVFVARQSVLNYLGGCLVCVGVQIFICMFGGLSFLPGSAYKKWVSAFRANVWI